MPVSTAEAAQILNKVFGGTNFTAETTWYVGLLSGGTELTGSGYARVAVTNNTTNWPAISANVKTNGTAITFPAASADWLTADEVGIWVASSGGSPKYRDALEIPVTVRSGQTREFEAGALTIRMI
jgi:hypothetical protein